MRLTAFDPPPPTPITLIRVPRPPSSSISYFKLSISASLFAISTLPSIGQTALSQNLPQPPGAFAVLFRLLFDLRRVHREPRRHRPLRAFQLVGPIPDPYWQ